MQCLRKVLALRVAPSSMGENQEDLAEGKWPDMDRTGWHWFMVRRLVCCCRHPRGTLVGRVFPNYIEGRVMPKTRGQSRTKSMLRSHATGLDVSVFWMFPNIGSVADTWTLTRFPTDKILDCTLLHLLGDFWQISSCCWVLGDVHLSGCVGEGSSWEVGGEGSS